MDQLRAQSDAALNRGDEATSAQICKQIWELPEIKAEWASMNEKLAQEVGVKINGDRSNGRVELVNQKGFDPVNSYLNRIGSTDRLVFDEETKEIDLLDLNKYAN